MKRQVCDKCAHCFLVHYSAGVYSSEKIADVFAYESSEIDWCEDNYKHSEHVVEYFNTVSSAGTPASNISLVINTAMFRICPLFFVSLINKSMFFLQMSSFFFFLISPIMLYLLHPYAKERSLAIHMVWVLMIFVGKSIFSSMLLLLFTITLFHTDTCRCARLTFRSQGNVLKIVLSLKNIRKKMLQIMIGSLFADNHFSKAVKLVFLQGFSLHTST